TAASDSRASSRSSATSATRRCSRCTPAAVTERASRSRGACWLASEARALADRVLAGEVRAAARAMRLIDHEAPLRPEAVGLLQKAGREAHLIGVTGAPGAGKSSVCDQLITHYRAQGKKVGVVAVDPSSPISGGAVLADRVRMQRHALDDGVFVRSLAAR